MALLPAAAPSPLPSPLQFRRLQSPNLPPPHLLALRQPTYHRRRRRSSKPPLLHRLRALLDPHRQPPQKRAKILVQLASPLIFFLVGLGSAAALAAVPVSPVANPAVIAVSDSVAPGAVGGESGEPDDETQQEFEAWKKKKFAWTVPLRVVALRGSFPASWLKDFVQSQSKRLKLQPEFRGSLQTIHQQLALAIKNASVDPKSVMAADVVTIGDTWFTRAIGDGIIEPINGAEGEQWFKDLSELWKMFLRRNHKGEPDPNGSIWGAPYRWGTVVIAYKKDKFKRNHFAPVEDWTDLWRPELAGKISMIASPREVVGSVLKYMGASYNTKDIDSELVGGRDAVMQNLALLQRQVRFFDSTHYLKAFTAGDVWVAVGWSSDVLPTAKRMSNVAVIIPKSGSSIWADIWAIPATSKVDTDKIGGRTRGPSPLVNQWIDFCLQPARAFAFHQEIIPGAAPSAFQNLPISEHIPAQTGRPVLDTNLRAGAPPPEILAKCEFLEPLSEKASADYQWLLENMQKRPSGNQLLSLFGKLIAELRGRTSLLSASSDSISRP